MALKMMGLSIQRLGTSEICIYYTELTLLALILLKM